MDATTPDSRPEALIVVYVPEDEHNLAEITAGPARTALCSAHAPDR